MLRLPGRLLHVANVAIATLIASIAWRVSAWAICPGSSYCPAPPSGCTDTLVNSYKACSTDSPYCCQYTYYVHAYSGPTCGTNKSCTDRLFNGSLIGVTCKSNGLCS